MTVLYRVGFAILALDFIMGGVIHVATIWGSGTDPNLVNAYLRFGLVGLLLSAVLLLRLVTYYNSVNATTPGGNAGTAKQRRTTLFLALLTWLFWVNAGLWFYLASRGAESVPGFQRFLTALLMAFCFTVLQPYLTGRLKPPAPVHNNPRLR
jgi:hypothetical protein